MSRIHFIILSIFLQSFLLNSIEANAIRRRRQQQQQQQQQPSGSFYGNSNVPGANPSAGFNYQPNTNYYGTGLNNQGSKDLYGNPVIPTNTGNNLNMGLSNQQQHQQQQQQQQPQNPLFGGSGQSLTNPAFPASGQYPPNTVNQIGGNVAMRDSSGNVLPAGSPGSPIYSPSNPQMGYPMNTNQGLTNKDSYNPNPNTNNNNNNNQYGLNSNPYANSNNYPGQSMLNNNNPWPNTNTNTNTQYNPNTGNAWNANRDSNTNTNNAYSNPNSPYFYNNHSDRLMNCSMLLMLLFLAQIYLHF